MWWDYDLMCIALAVAAVVLVIASVAMVIYVIYHYIVRGVFARTHTVPAQVLRKYQNEAGAGPYFDTEDDACGGSLGDYAPGYSFFIVFRVGGGQMDFCVSERVYADVSEGDTGFLVHKGTLFRRFVKDSYVSLTTGKTRIRKVNMS